MSGKCGVGREKLKCVGRQALGVWSTLNSQLPTPNALRLTLFILLTALCLLPIGTAYTQKVEDNGKERVWKRNPFAPPDITETPLSEPFTLEASAILYSKERSSAVINGRTVHVGDELHGYRILDIKRTYVILGKGKKSFKVELKK